MNREIRTIDGNEAAAHIAYRTNEVIAIYPITPASPMGEWADVWSSMNQKNIWGSVPFVQEMQSEGGAVGVVHGALQAGALSCTFTASQGLLLMLPNMYKIAGELTPTVFHVASRSLAAQALSIFGDHSDVMAARSTGFAQLASSSVQECMDFALIAQASTLDSRIPFIHFFDGFRTSHEISKIEVLSDDDIRLMIDSRKIQAHRSRALTPDDPKLRGTAQNPDVYFQARESVNQFYAVCPDIVQKNMDKFASMTGRTYQLFDYIGASDAERVIVIMGSGGDTAQETVESLLKKGEKVGVLKVRLYRPFDQNRFLNALPKTVKYLAVLDRCKEPGSSGEPLYMDVVNAISENRDLMPAPPKIIGGRYGLSSKEFTPAMVKSVFDECKKPKPKNHFTIGILDDVTGTSLDYDPGFITEPPNDVKAIFYGLGSDGTVSANKNSIKIIGDITNNYAQGYFVYDSKKAGSQTTSHLRFGPRPIRSAYLVQQADFVACHQFSFLDAMDPLEKIRDKGVFLLNSPFGPENVWDYLPQSIQESLIKKKIKFYVIDAYKVARDNNLGGRINTIMQTCFFAISDVLPKEVALKAVKDSINKSYGKKGEEIIRMNFNAVDQAIAHLHEVNVPAKVSSTRQQIKFHAEEASDFINTVTFPLIAGKGDALPVSVFPVDGTYPTGTTKWEKRNIAQEIPVWDEKVCIQCAKCVIVCPHAVIRPKIMDESVLQNKPATFKTAPAMNRSWAGKTFTLQISSEDCTGCGICVDICPAKNKSETRLKAINMEPAAPIKEREKIHWDYFQSLPEIDRRSVEKSEVRANQLLEPLFEFSGACAGCGETPYIKLLTQLFGDRLLVANATGCSSIYGGNLPTTPWTKNSEGRGPAWSNSLFEDNAEFGLGFRLALLKQTQYAAELLLGLSSEIGQVLVDSIIQSPQQNEADIYEQRERVQVLKEKLKNIKTEKAKILLNLADHFVKKSVWILGGDGWGYDIGFGGLDHVLSSGHNVKVLLLDTEVYSNTGGQMSKATPIGAIAKFAASGKPSAKKDLGLMIMTYGNIYVASVAMGARDEHTIRCFLEAEKYDGPALIIAYSHCIAHGINMTTAMRDQKLAVTSGYWPLYRYNPDLGAQGKNPLQLDSTKPSVPLKEFMYRQNRFKMLTKSDPIQAKKLLDKATQKSMERWRFYEHLASMKFNDEKKI